MARRISMLNTSAWIREQWRGGDDLFVPIVGERVDAHRFLPGNCQQGDVGLPANITAGEDVKSLCPAAVRGKTKEQERESTQAAWIEVSDTKALQDLGSFCGNACVFPWWEITGSVGRPLPGK